MFKNFLIHCIRFYQRHISTSLGPSCRFIPCCSQYAIEAIQRYGALRGSLKAVWRILRCNPLSRGGYDPVDPADKERYRREFLSKTEGSANAEKDKKCLCSCKPRLH